MIGITRSAWKRELAETLGATATAPPEEAEDLVRDITKGLGASVVVECVGSEPTLAQAIELAGYAADIVVFGTLTSGSGSLPYYQLYLKELTIHNPRAAASADYDTGIALAAADRIALSPIVTSRHRLEDAEKAFDDIGGEHLKVVVDISGKI